MLILFALLLVGRANASAKKALAEANDFFSGFYHIEIVGDNGLALLAYKTDVLHIGDQTQWDGIATVGAYNMAFQQECHSVYTSQVQAKQWRGKWVCSTATTPAEQLQSWLSQVAGGEGVYNAFPVKASTLLPLNDGEDRKVVTVRLTNAPLDWNALCDAHIDSMFGTQAYLTDIKKGTVTLCFDAATHELFGVVFAAEKGQTTITGSILVSTADGRTLQDFPTPEELGEGTLYEEWEQVSSES